MFGPMIRSPTEGRRVLKGCTSEIYEVAPKRYLAVSHICACRNLFSSLRGIADSVTEAFDRTGHMFGRRPQVQNKAVSLPVDLTVK